MCSSDLGQYGVNDLYVGVPTVIGSAGVERVVELDLTAAEREQFAASVDSVRRLVDMVRMLAPSITKPALATKSAARRHA